MATDALCGPIFVPMYNAVLRKDVTGAFLPEAREFRAKHGGTIHRFDNRKPSTHRRVDVLDGLIYGPTVTPFRSVSFFCHGLARSLQAGFDLDSVGLLAKAIRNVSVADVVVILYACSTASGLSRQSPGGDGGFADTLRDRLVEAGARHCRVVAHSTAGHATRNPNVRFFDGPGDVGGISPVDPGDDLWRRWTHALKTDFRFDFPFMSIDAIRAYLEA
jgi:hypothetical protein